jgi:predicted DNA-binding transcriptional regulator YafY
VNRTDRLYALVEELRAVSPRPRTARWLAAHFEVSVRTIERDVGALLEAGVPISAERGHGGGYAVDRRHTLPPLNVTPAEATALAVALTRLGNSPFEPAARTLLNKVLAAMPPDTVSRAARLAERVHVEEPDGAGPVPRAVYDAMQRGRVVELTYEDKTGARTQRMVEPVGLLSFEGRWYLQARCRLRGRMRAFRTDRVIAAVATDEPAPPASMPDLGRLIGKPIEPLHLGDRPVPAAQRLAAVGYPA